MNEPRLFTTEALEAARCPEPPVEDLDCWVVVACLDGQSWSVRNGTYLTQEAAREAATKLAPCWTHRHIVHIHISGKEAAK